MKTEHHLLKFDKALLLIGLAIVLSSCGSQLKIAQVGNKQLPLTISVPAAHQAQLKVTRIAHACVLIEYQGHTLLTDPWFTQTKEYPPGEKLGIALDSLPQITAITSTMDHYDHFDVEGIKNSKLKNVPVLVPEGTKQQSKATAAGLTDIRAISPGETVTVGIFKIMAIKARAYTKPKAFDYETAWKIEAGDWKILVIGHRISKELLSGIGPIDLVILPVNDLRIKPMFKKLSMSPKEAAIIANAVQAKIAIPDHYMYKSTWLWETFIVSHKGTAQAFAEAYRELGGNAIQLQPGVQLILQGKN